MAGGAAAGFGLSIFFLAMMAVGIVGMVFWIVALIEVAKVPDDAFRAAGTEKLTWLLVVALVGWIGALIYWFGTGQQLTRIGAVGAGFCERCGVHVALPARGAVPAGHTAGLVPEPGGRRAAVVGRSELDRPRGLTPTGPLYARRGGRAGGRGDPGPAHQRPGHVDAAFPAALPAPVELGRRLRRHRLGVPRP